MVTVAVAVEPTDTPVGSAPRPNTILSPSSSKLSWTAARSKVAVVAVAPKVTLAGTPE